ncbi:MAG: GAF domain-containing protein [Chloroflexi bacterium]|nr:GAF domain-containing protein [Chloroflexota bacterium]
MTVQTDSIAEKHPKERKFKNSLARSVAIALLLFAMVPVSIMGLTGYLQARRLLREQTASQIHNITNNLADSFDSSINNKLIRLERISKSPAFLGAAETLLANNSGNASAYQEAINTEFDLINRPLGRPLFDGFALLSNEGIVYAASEDNWVGTSLADSPYLEKITNPKEAVGLYDVSPTFSKKYVVFSAIPLVSDEGEGLGTLLGLTQDDAIKNILKEATLYNASAVAYFISANDSFVGIDPYTEELEAFTPSAEQKSAIAQYSSGNDEENETRTLLEFDNNFDIEVIAQVHFLEASGSKIILEIPREVAFGQLGNLGPFSIFLFLSTLLVLGTVLFFASNRIVRPLRELSRTSRQFSQGNWLERAPVERDDEIGELEYSFNQMADELSSLYNTLKHQVDERTEYISIASDVAQSIVSTFNLDELLDKTAHLVVERFDYYHAGIFMVGRAGKTATLKAAHGPSATEMLERKHQLEVGSESIVGWVSEHNEPRAASDVGDDPVHFKNELLPDTRAEVGIPISVGDTVLGVLDVQSTHPESFDEATISVLVTLSNQLATAIQNVSLFESSDVNLHELDRLYRASRDIAQEKNADNLLETAGRILRDSPFITTIFVPKGKGTGIFSASDPDYETSRFNLAEFIDIPLEQIAEGIKTEGMLIELGKNTPFPKAFIDIPRKTGAQIISLLSIKQADVPKALVVIGARNKDHLTQTAINPYINLLEMVTITLDKIKSTEATGRRLSEMEAISITNQATAATQDLNALYPILHEQVRQVLGDFPFAVARYDKQKNSIDIPYLYEDGKVAHIDTFPLGEGLTSIVIRTAQPLMIVENTVERSAALGAKLVGKPAKSWLGSPLMIEGKVTGAIIVQDLENEKSFDESSLRFINTLATQVSGAIHNAQLLEDSRKRTMQLESAAEIARDISSSLHMDELLSNAVNMIRERFDFYHASVFLIDSLGEYASIREGTGDAGAQLKRNGYKLEVGSRSIVGFVTKRGETLVVDNTAQDATYYANPLLPDTRSEAAIPLKVGERILGALDVQSTQPYDFPPESLQTLNIIADQLAVAVINTELFAETQEHLSQHRLLHHITTSAASGTTIEESLRGAVQGLQVSLGGDRVAILLIDKEQENLYIGASVGYSDADQKLIVPVGSGVTGWVARNQKLLRIDDTDADPRYLAVSKNTRSELAIPLVFRKELLGVLNVESERIAAYTEEDEEMLGTLAGSLAAIIANARLLQRMRRQAERERLLREITGKIRRSTDVQTILATTAQELTNAVGAQRAHVRVVAEKPIDTENKHE